MADIDRDTLIHQKGYQILEKIRDIPQGSLWRAKVTAEGDCVPKGSIGSIVAIKRVDKLLRNEQECKSKEFGMTELVQEDIEKEAVLVLRVYLVGCHAYDVTV